MSADLSPVRVADDVFEFQVETSRHAQALARQLRSVEMAEDVVAGLDRVAVRFKPARAEQIEAWLSEVTAIRLKDENDLPVIDIPVQYGGDAGPDLAAICKAMEFSEEAFISVHTGAEHLVEMIGFTPGFSYISGLSETFEVSRLGTPRPRVPAGSIGISAAFTGIYALAGPGGWPLIGRTSAPLFDPQAPEPFHLQPGQRVKFKAV
ncbi:MAG: 5-oxoprolinase subunit PxpB [Pseudomonadota bacterium]